MKCHAALSLFFSSVLCALSTTALSLGVAVSVQPLSLSLPPPPEGVKLPSLALKTNRKHLLLLWAVCGLADRMTAWLCCGSALMQTQQEDQG